MVGGREGSNQIWWELANHQDFFHISGGFQGWLPRKDSGCCRAFASHWVPAALLAKEGPIPALGTEQHKDFSGSRMVHCSSSPTPTPITPLRTQWELQVRASLRRGSKEQVQSHFPVSPPHHPTGPSRDLEWNVPPLLCPAPKPQMEVMLFHESPATGCICGEEV